MQTWKQRCNHRTTRRIGTKESKMHYIETQKIKVEIEKMKSEMFWQPFKIAATVITAVAALTATITTLIIKFM